MIAISKSSVLAIIFGMTLTGVTARALDDQMVAQILKNTECPSVEDVLKIFSIAQSGAVQAWDSYEDFLRDPRIMSMEPEEVSKDLQDLMTKYQGVKPLYSYDSVEEVGNVFKICEHQGRLNLTTLRDALTLDQYKDQELSIKDAISSYEKCTRISGEIVKILNKPENKKITE